MRRNFIILLSLLLVFGSSALYAKTSLFIWITDMYNQKSIKPQEEGSLTKFPIGSVTVKGNIYESYDERFNWIEREMDPETTTQNPVSADKKSLANGKLKFRTYCRVCHGENQDMTEAGFAKRPVNEKGMVAPVITFLSPGFSDGYIFNKAKYGGSVMPPLGISTTAKDRWDIINYVRMLEKKYEEEE